MFSLSIFQHYKSYFYSQSVYFLRIKMVSCISIAVDRYSRQVSLITQQYEHYLGTCQNYKSSSLTQAGRILGWEISKLCLQALHLIWMCTEVPQSLLQIVIHKYESDNLVAMLLWEFWCMVGPGKIKSLLLEAFISRETMVRKKLWFDCWLHFKWVHIGLLQSCFVNCSLNVLKCNCFFISYVQEQAFAILNKGVY